jgi:hypothetical protein
LPPVRQLLQHRTLPPRPPRPRLCFLSLAFCHKSSSVRYSLPSALAPPHLPPSASRTHFPFLLRRCDRAHPLACPRSTPPAAARMPQSRSGRRIPRAARPLLLCGSPRSHHASAGGDGAAAAARSAGAVPLVFHKRRSCAISTADPY